MRFPILTAIRAAVAFPFSPLGSLSSDGQQRITGHQLSDEFSSLSHDHWEGISSTDRLLLLHAVTYGLFPPATATEILQDSSSSQMLLADDEKKTANVTTERAARLHKPHDDRPTRLFCFAVLATGMSMETALQGLQKSPLSRASSSGPGPDLR